jgi:hypothetical protein
MGVRGTPLPCIPTWNPGSLPSNTQYPHGHGRSCNRMLGSQGRLGRHRAQCSQCSQCEPVRPPALETSVRNPSLSAADIQSLRDGPGRPETPQDKGRPPALCRPSFYSTSSPRHRASVFPSNQSSQLSASGYIVFFDLHCSSHPVFGTTSHPSSRIFEPGASISTSVCVIQPAVSNKPYCAPPRTAAAFCSPHRTIATSFAKAHSFFPSSAHLKRPPAGRHHRPSSLPATTFYLPIRHF